ncbi:hypothetical protein TNCV_3876971 [Trichonephila clavipes]|uniref:Uncharacterized protein n=1 Tax=Trichonephila clavipes TaxID=2585209 RepID=A0A8X6VMK0_TRICX|nr:hypothetical protein TNCV_3876971 [Trichonephila clavipes]
MYQGATNSVFQTTVQQSLLRLVLRSRRLVHAPMLTASHQQRRLEFSLGTATGHPMRGDSQLTSLDKNNALREIKLRLSYLQGKSTTMSVIAHQTEKEWISANEKSRQRMSQTEAEGTAKQHAARLEEVHLRAHHSCFTTSERC